MLRRLLIKNLVLVESSEIHFHEGFNVLTGETGAGKSIILSSLGLLRASRLDTSLIRQGAETSLVEASFDAASVAKELEETGISCEDEVVIRRELTHTGKSRAFINDQTVQLAFLKKITSRLIEISSQHAHLELLDSQGSQELLDNFADLLETRKLFQISYRKCLDLQSEIDQFAKKEQERSRLMETCRREIEEIEAVSPEDGEDDLIFKEYTSLATTAENAQLIKQILAYLDNDESSALLMLSQARPLIDKLSQFKAMQESFRSALANLQELSFELSREAEKAESQETRFQEIEERLKELHTLKKKYGSSLSEVLSWNETQKAKLKLLEKENFSLDELEDNLAKATKETDRLAAILTKRRKDAAKTLSEKVTRELNTLNMPHAIFEAELEQTSRSSCGDEQVTFYLTANRGEPKVAIQDAASGGELARLSLALKCVMCDKNPVDCILFDEIDANIGGETAAIVGKKLSQLSKSCQVIAITHFPQVAFSADCHFQIAKKEHKGRTTSHIKTLTDQAQIEAEISRMMGGASAFIANSALP